MTKVTETFIKNILTINAIINKQKYIFHYSFDEKRASFHYLGPVYGAWNLQCNGKLVDWSECGNDFIKKPFRDYCDKRLARYYKLMIFS